MFTPKQIKTFNESEMSMYYYVLNNKDKIPYMTIREFAAEVHSSTTSVLRFCSKIDCSGFMEFKVRFKQILENEQSRISYSDDKVSLFHDFLAKVETSGFVEKLNRAIQLIKQRDKLFCAGAGPTGSIAYYAAAHLSAAGYFAIYIDEYSMSTESKLSDDTYLLFCVSGESKEMIEFVERIKRSGGRTILITNSNFSTLSQISDLVIAYNIYYAKSLQKTVPTLAGQEDMDNVVDSFSTQLPSVYLIEAIAEALTGNREERI